MNTSKKSPLAFVHKPGCAKPDPVAVCKCGANAVCRTCRWGRGAMPCKCSPGQSLGNG